MSEVKRFNVSRNGAVYSEPLGLYVLYTDHAAEVSALEAKVDLLEEKVAAAKVAAKEWREAFTSESQQGLDLRSQLEAAKRDVREAKEDAKHWQGMCTLYADHRNDLQAQLTAQPDGVREAAQKLVDFCMDGTPRDGSPLEALVDALDEALGTAALTTPAASTPPEGKVRELTEFYEAQTAWDAIDGEDHDEANGVAAWARLVKATAALSQALAAPAPACKNPDCIGGTLRSKAGRWNIPCPDCNAGEGKKP